MYTGGFSPRGAGGRGLKGSGEHWERLAVHRRDCFAWVAWPAGPGVRGRQGDTGTTQGLGVVSQLSAVPILLDREHR